MERSVSQPDPPRIKSQCVCVCVCECGRGRLQGSQPHLAEGWEIFVFIRTDRTAPLAALLSLLSVGGTVTPQSEEGECLRVQTRGPAHPDPQECAGAGAVCEITGCREETRPVHVEFPAAPCQQYLS
ncbi:hypothetical protein GBF38_021320 [Xyrichtys novacula]|uniref:Uncharacterized protein n=1 Tax=Xyrichtys novacula TaxID=13765 RepID=A0AAV1GNQ1_XYRNO|nr:hypothetical protein GBF38_021320 [Xyrichtys novacula]